MTLIYSIDGGHTTVKVYKPKTRADKYYFTLFFKGKKQYKSHLFSSSHDLFLFMHGFTECLKVNEKFYKLMHKNKGVIK